MNDRVVILGLLAACLINVACLCGYTLIKPKDDIRRASYSSFSVVKNSG